jgi:hypothetical protein
MITIPEPNEPNEPYSMFTITAEPAYATVGDIVKITIESNEPLQGGIIDSVTVTDQAGQPISFSSANPSHPLDTRWVYQTIPLPESVARGTAMIVVIGTDSESITHTGTGSFEIMEPHEPAFVDLWILSEDISFSDEDPNIGETINIAAVIHARSENTRDMFNVPVSFYAHHGSGESYQIGRTILIEHLPMGVLEWVVSTTWRNAAAGDYIIEVEIGPGFSDDNNGNNQATRSISVGIQMVIVPDVLNMTEAEAEASLLSVGLAKGTVTHQYNDIVPAGQVMEQTPIAGTSVPFGSAVNIVISDGPRVPQSVDSLVSVYKSDARFDRATGKFSVTVTVTNISNEVIYSPLWLVIESISDPNVTLADSDGTTPDGKPYIDISGLLVDSKFEPGDIITKQIWFNNPKRVRFTFDEDVRGMLVP